MKLTVVCAFVFLNTFLSCTTKCPCSPASLAIRLISFSTAEEDTIILKRFAKGTNFQTLEDSLLVDSSNCFYDKQGTDSVVLSIADSSGILNTNFDYEIYIPSVNRLIKVSALAGSQTEGSCGRCVDPLTSYIVDGQLHNDIPLSIVK